MQRLSQKNFRNWAGNVQYLPQQMFLPQGADEIAEIVKNHQQIALTGSSHSWSQLCVGDGALIRTQYFNKISNLDAEKRLVTVQSGVKLWQLNNYLHERGFALSNLGSIAKQSVVGAMATGTHGSGLNFQILASQMQSFVLLQAGGQQINVDRDENPELFQLAAVNLGALGVVLQATLRVVPAFQLQESAYVLDFEQGLSRLDEFLQQTDHFKLWWFPHTDKFVVFRYQRTQQPANDSKMRQWLIDEILSVYLYRTLVHIGHLHHPWRRPLNRLLVNHLMQPLERIERSDRVFNVPEPPIHRETEWAFDVNRAAELLREYKKRIDAGPHHINFIQEIRFTKGDDFALSPCYKRDSIWIGAYNIDTIGWPALLRDFEDFAVQHDGRPHWGKEFTVDTAYLRQHVARLGDFAALRQQLDPNGKFLTPLLNRILH